MHGSSLALQQEQVSDDIIFCNCYPAAVMNAWPSMHAPVSAGPHSLTASLALPLQTFLNQYPPLLPLMLSAADTHPQTLAALHCHQVPYDEAHAYAEENSIIHLETSAKSGLNVKSVFVEVATRLPLGTAAPEREGFPIVPPRSDGRAGGGCC